MLSLGSVICASLLYTVLWAGTWTWDWLQRAALTPGWVSLHSGLPPEKVEWVVPAQLIQPGPLCSTGGNRSCRGTPGHSWALAGQGDHPHSCPNLHSLSLHLSWDFSALQLESWRRYRVQTNNFYTLMWSCVADLEFRGGRVVLCLSSSSVWSWTVLIRGNFICPASCETYSGVVCIISLSVIYCVLILNKNSISLGVLFPCVSVVQLH